MRHKILRAIGVLLVLIVFAIVLLPWKQWVGSKLIAALEAKGFSHVELTVSSAGLSGATLSHVSIGDPPLTLDHLTINYRPDELWHGQLRSIALSGLRLEARETEQGWTILGLESLFAKTSADKPTTIPLTREALAVVPFDRALLDGTLHVVGRSFTADMPLNIQWVKPGQPAVANAGEGSTGRIGEMTWRIGKLFLGAKLDLTKAQWNIGWQVEDLVVTNAAIALPAMTCKGANGSIVSNASVRINGGCSSADQRFLIDFALDYPLAQPQQPALIITRASMPWSGGTLSLRSTRLPLGKKQATTINLNVDKVAIDQLMQSLTGDRVKATGSVSGIIPVTIASNGDITFQNASLKAEQPGVIALAPETIPGDNPQVALVRDVLKNLHYQLLALEVDNGDDGKLGVTLVVEGNNPDVQGGRPVKLKVHLRGDVLDLVKQNLQLMTDPQKFIQQEAP